MGSSKLIQCIKTHFIFRKKVEQTPRYFAFLTPGHSGSLWLTKILNSHPDVLCWHEGVYQRVFPLRYWQVTKKDRLAWFNSIRHPSANHYRKIYKAIGDVGSLTIDNCVFTRDKR